MACPDGGRERPDGGRERPDGGRGQVLTGDSWASQISRSMFDAGDLSAPLLRSHSRAHAARLFVLVSVVLFVLVALVVSLVVYCRGAANVYDCDNQP